MFKILLELATKVVFKHTAKMDNLPSELKEITEDRIKEVQDTYDDVIEQFIDSIFDAESKLSNEDWKKLVTKKEDWIVQPDKIRLKLYPELEYLKTNNSWF